MYTSTSVMYVHYNVFVCLTFLLFYPQEKAAKWKNPDGHMDGLTTNGVLVMHPRGGFTEESKPGVWREISVCGDVYTLRETRSAQTRGKLVSSTDDAPPLHSPNLFSHLGQEMNH